MKTLQFTPRTAKPFVIRVGPTVAEFMAARHEYVMQRVALLTTQGNLKALANLNQDVEAWENQYLEAV